MESQGSPRAVRTLWGSNSSQGNSSRSQSQSPGIVHSHVTSQEVALECRERWEMSQPTTEEARDTDGRWRNRWKLGGIGEQRQRMNKHIFSFIQSSSLSSTLTQNRKILVSYCYPFNCSMALSLKSWKSQLLTAEMGERELSCEFLAKAIIPVGWKISS